MNDDNTTDQVKLAAEVQGANEKFATAASDATRKVAAYVNRICKDQILSDSDKNITAILVDLLVNNSNEGGDNGQQ